jgi:hypothetical protein
MSFLTRILAAICVVSSLLAAGAARAADLCYIREYSALGVGLTNVAQIAQEPGIADQVSPDFTSGAQQFVNPFNVQTSIVCMVCNANASYLVGANPTATGSNFPVIANSPPWCFGVPLGKSYKLSVHTNP